MENELFSGESELDILRADPEYYLEVAADYSEMNLTDDAIRILEIYGENTNARDYPILYYYLGFFNDELKRKEEAAAYFKKAATCNPDYIFPFRIETESVLKVALEYNSSDWKAHYYLGNLLVAKLRWEEGLEHFKNAAAFSPEFPVIYRNLGEIYWKKYKDYERAREMYEKAVSFAPYDYRLYLALDELYTLTREHPFLDRQARALDSFCHQHKCIRQEEKQLLSPSWHGLLRLPRNSRCYGKAFCCKALSWF
ncbi:hypothetical protein ES705_43740 [subsurface metagenome]